MLNFIKFQYLCSNFQNEKKRKNVDKMINAYILYLTKFYLFFFITLSSFFVSDNEVRRMNGGDNVGCWFNRMKIIIDVFMSS